MESYAARVVDHELDELVGALSAIAIEGPKAVGKTETAQRRARTVYRLDDSTTAEIIAADPQRLRAGPHPILIDEWQRFPSSWDIVRRAVDDDPRPGQYLLTGSASPTDAPTHSGAGRVVTVRMRPMSLVERYPGIGTVSLATLLAGTRLPIDGTTTLTIDDYAHEIVSSGFPAIRALSGRALRTQLDGYIERIVERDFAELGHRVRNEGALRRWLTAYAAATSTTASFETIRDAASTGGNTPAKSTTLPYRSILEQLWIIEDVPGWLPTHNQLRRLATAPVHQLADPALAARLLGIDAESLTRTSNTTTTRSRTTNMFGPLFESLVTLSTRVYAQANEARVAHLRTHSGKHEVDLIIERSDGRIVALEVKLKANISDHDTRHLQWLQERIGPDLLDAAIITTGTTAYRRTDGIAIIPAALLTP